MWIAGRVFLNLCTKESFFSVKVFTVDFQFSSFCFGFTFILHFFDSCFIISF